MASKLDIFYEQSEGCPMYEPCPICYKCQMKASHLYLQCQDCPLEFCGHDDKQRNLLIRKENFAIKLSEEAHQSIERAKENSNETK